MFLHYCFIFLFNNKITVFKFFFGVAFVHRVMADVIRVFSIGPGWTYLGGIRFKCISHIKYSRKWFDFTDDGFDTCQSCFRCGCSDRGDTFTHIAYFLKCKHIHIADWKAKIAMVHKIIAGNHSNYT